MPNNYEMVIRYQYIAAMNAKGVINKIFLAEILPCIETLLMIQCVLYNV